MDLREPIVIVSIFGRGNYLAAKLAKAGIPVTLLDASHHMGTWYPEDIEGPFGFFDVQEVQLERLKVDEDVLTLPQGFSIWLKSGPLELRGAVTQHRLHKLGISPLAYKALENVQLTKEELQEFKKLKFEQKWIVNLAAYFSNSVEERPAETLKNLSLNSVQKANLLRNFTHEFHYRKVTPLGSAKSLSWCESMGVRVIRDVEIKDLVFEDNRKLITIEVRTDRPGILQAEQVIFCLTAEETEKISLKVKKFLFGDKNSQPDWVWLRYRGAIAQAENLQENQTEKSQSQNLSQFLRALPDHFLMIEDEFIHWSHGNFVIAQRAFDGDRKLESQFDLWVKVPQHLRFNTHYLEIIWKEIQTNMEARLPRLSLDLVELPLEAKNTFDQLGPARFPVYSASLNQIRRAERAANLHFDSPEFWDDLSWEGIFKHQDQIFSKIEVWWKHREEMRLKREAKLAAAKAARGLSNDEQSPKDSNETGADR